MSVTKLYRVVVDMNLVAWTTMPKTELDEYEKLVRKATRKCIQTWNNCNNVTLREIAEFAEEGDARECERDLIGINNKIVVRHAERLKEHEAWVAWTNKRPRRSRG